MRIKFFILDNSVFQALHRGLHLWGPQHPLFDEGLNEDGNTLSFDQRRPHR